MRASAAVHRLPQPPFKLDEGPRTAAFVQQEIFRSGWSYTMVADKAGVSNVTVGLLAQGVTLYPRMRTVVLILAALGFDVYASERR